MAGSIHGGPGNASKRLTQDGKHTSMAYGYAKSFAQYANFWRSVVVPQYEYHNIDEYFRLTLLCLSTNSHSYVYMIYALLSDPNCLHSLSPSLF